MNGELRQGRMNSGMNNMSNASIFSLNERNEKMEQSADMPLVHESCNCSGFTMAAVGASLLMFVGIIVYALIV